MFYNEVNVKFYSCMYPALCCRQKNTKIQQKIQEISEVFIEVVFHFESKQKL